MECGMKVHLRMPNDDSYGGEAQASILYTDGSLFSKTYKCQII